MHGLHVAIYDQSGQALRGPARVLRDVQFSSSLPGGFDQCALSIEGGARSLPLAAGQTLAVRQRGAVVWWGWIEDVQIVQRGNVERAAVLALGPWQQLQQRLVSDEFSGAISSAVVRDALAGYAPEISRDYSRLDYSGVTLTRTYEHDRLANLVDEVCSLGDSSQRPLLFAIWEPPGSSARVASAGNLVDDSEFSLEELRWEPSDPSIEYVSSPVVSPPSAWKFPDGVEESLRHRRRFAVAASTVYMADYYVYFTAHENLVVYLRFDWYDASDTLISSDFTEGEISKGLSAGWQRVQETITSPAGAVDARVFFIGESNGGAGAASYLAVDDLLVYASASALEPDTAPRARLWSRDLTDYDYTLRTADVAAGVQTTETTRDLANAVLATYGSSSYTAFAEDAASQALYRRRDHLVQAGQVALADAQAQRDVYLALHSDPGLEVASFVVRRPGTVRTKRGLPVHPARLRAGDRLLIVDGGLAGSVILLAEVRWQDGAATCRPESYEDVTRVLARV
jgi:hypothetical protein